ncbi:T9SS type A sorting domain-containing protein [Saccharicrinis sp. 156]|uniref:T9SS type A sorting domain-containing protein n=1 Tax=Saccharicrinis sp. 156 TaxID=3417574 RepID=UPI003D352347
MKNLFLTLLVSLPILLSAQDIGGDYYVAVYGDDNNPGTYELPFGTWQKAFDSAQAGDTVYFRGGTYYVGSGEKVTYDPRTGHGNSGTRNNWICFMNYPGETPILDGTNTTNYEELFEAWHTSYVLFKGLVFQNKWQNKWNQIIRQAVFYENGTIQIENCISRNSGGYGFTINAWDTLYCYNNDSYEHYNLKSDDPGNKPDGFAIASGGETTDYGEMIGCRAWRCSDDGIEASWATEMLVDGCWTFCNGFLSGGAGVGIKYGPGYIEHAENRITQRCIAAWNKGPAYSFQNIHHQTNGPIGNFFNNLSYKCEIGFQSIIGDWDCAVGDTYLKFHNNINYNNTNKSLDQLNLVSCGGKKSEFWQGDHNTWVWKSDGYLYTYNNTIGWSHNQEDSQWALLPDSAATQAILSAPRKADGSLPDIGDAFKLSSTSDLIDKGVYVGIPYSGSAPDLGPFEYNPNIVFPTIKFTSYSPNPTHDLVYLTYQTESSFVSIKVINDGGNIVYNSDINTGESKSSKNGDYKHVINMKHFQEGVYTIILSDGTYNSSCFVTKDNL